MTMKIPSLPTAPPYGHTVNIQIAAYQRASHGDGSGAQCVRSKCRGVLKRVGGRLHSELFLEYHPSYVQYIMFTTVPFPRIMHVLKGVLWFSFNLRMK